MNIAINPPAGNANTADSGLLVPESPLVRVLIAVTLGAIIALALSWFMWVLIDSGEQRLDESGRVQLLDFVRVERTQTVETKTRTLARPNNTPPPATPQAPAQESATAESALAVEALPTGMDSSVDMSNSLSFGSQDGDYLPIVKVAAIYPIAAMQRGIEGTCLVTYTVTPKGTVKNVSVVAGQCDHPSFEKVSIDAAQKFRYKPRVVNGDAIEVEEVYNRFIFALQRD